MSDLQDIIVTSTVRAFNSGYEVGIREGRKQIMEAVNFVKVDYYDHEVAIISDLEEEIVERANLYHSTSPQSASEHGKVANDE